SGRANGLRGIDVSTILGTSQNVAGHSERQNLTMAVFRTSADTDQSPIDEVQETRICSFGKNRNSAPPIDEQCCVPCNVLLLLSRKQVSVDVLPSTRCLERPGMNIQMRPGRAAIRA